MKWLFVFLIVGLLVGGAIYSGMTAATVVELTPATKTDIREFVDEQAVTRVPLTHSLRCRTTDGSRRLSSPRARR